MTGRDVALASACNFRALRARGITVRKTIDMLIARLTALGIRGVPESTKEAATALGLSNPEDALEGNKLV